MAYVVSSTHHARRRLIRSVIMKLKQAAFALAIIASAFGVFMLILDYSSTRSSTSFALLLNQLPEGTPFAVFEKRFGEPAYHFTDEHVMSEWGPSADPELLQKSELYYFFCRSSFPFRYICVYRDKGTGRVERVMWKSM